MKDDAVIKDNEAVYLLNEQTYLHLRENLAGVGYEIFDKNSPLPVEEGQIPREALGNTQRRIETARAYYLAEHQDEPVVRIDMEKTQYSKLISAIPKPDIAISMGCNVSCPFIGRPFDENWGLDDPTGKSDDEFKAVMEQIRQNILALKSKLCNGSSF